MGVRPTVEEHQRGGDTLLSQFLVHFNALTDRYHSVLPAVNEGDRCR